MVFRKNGGGPIRSADAGRRAALAALSLALWPASGALARAFQTPAQVPALPSALIARSPLMAVARAGRRIVVAGPRGHVAYSDDNGQRWTQASVPVSSDLVALVFPTARDGWAVGHGGIVIHSADAGATWTRQMDGEAFSTLALRYYEARAAERETPEIALALSQAKALAGDGSTRALLDVYFQDARTGFVVGAFNRIFRTDDGGKSWTPWMERTGNRRELHFYSIRDHGGRLQLTGEQGMVWEIDPGRGSFTPRPTPYQGTLFGSFGEGADLFVYGMRGSLFRSSDRGVSWTKVALPEQAGITGAVSDGDGRLVLATQVGKLLVSEDAGRTFRTVSPAEPMSYFGIGGAADGKLVLVGSAGVRIWGRP